MISSILFRVSAAAAALLLAVSGPAALGDSVAAVPAEGAAANPEAAQPSSSKKVYEGMPAADLQALIGKPKRIVPVKLPEGKTAKAELWVYERLKATTTESVAVGTKPITSRRRENTADGAVDVDAVVGFDVVKENHTVEIYQIASFLIVDGVYLTCKNTEERRQTFQ